MIGIRSFMAKKEQTEPKWYVIDATDKHLGRLAARVALVLTGKHRPTYTPHVDTGDFVVIINAEKVGLTGNKRQQSVLHHFSGYPGGLKTTTYGEVLAKRPERLVERVVWGMLPKTRLGRAMYKKLKVYAGPNHPHAAQKPETLEL
ncbi:50S ribosomal protein L13 [Aminomonas paucivorans]|uniref:Large ribosomal subunit protein uL13 n=1 Tax=Aminomonas paucivorans DSM 12260 TaxID=584708 RepID=E3CWJ4_9BACT|nr:50S ribosomal protein L13 [Aminomonas paucivorans]EFQ24349.1 LSU ribosomal protein L13P [Aminomonas paucivorans DSM 12260]